MTTKFRTLLASAVCVASVFTASSGFAQVDTVNVYTIGSSPEGLALDPVGANIGGIQLISWQHNLVATTPGKPVYLRIRAEGIDSADAVLAPAGEVDGVFFNGFYVGDLTQQGFFSPLANLRPGPGALAGITGLTTSWFDVTPWYVPGVNTVAVTVDQSAAWVNEIEVSQLIATVPEPSTWALMIVGVGATGFALRRRSALAAA